MVIFFLDLSSGTSSLTSNVALPCELTYSCMSLSTSMLWLLNYLFFSFSNTLISVMKLSSNSGSSVRSFSCC